ncbi:MAG TPA: sigma-70 family RNA polymerase sigma factor [Polyangiaceae bacterium]|jgi:RNA polymerase sigma-70 factor (ECF subfamily)|nr:sigma-70 family RNA polymerase sigma factor [Polyangiaceae bacterium]
MNGLANASLSRAYRENGARIHAALVRRFHDLDLAEDAVQEALVAALEQWGDTTPDDPAAWLVRTAFHKGVDRLRRARLHRDKQGVVAELSEPEAVDDVPSEDLFRQDDTLRLVFLCCHPALPFESQVALTLRTVSCLTTAEIARAFLVPEATMAQRLVRAKSKIRDAGIPFRTPDESEIDERIDAVLSVVYLVFNEGYAVTAGQNLVREDLCTEALRLVRLVVDLAPQSGPSAGLRALLLLTDARRAARVDAHGDVVLLEDQDRSLWNREQTEWGLAEVERAIRLGPPRHPYTLQAAIAAVHARAGSAAETRWDEIASLYELLADVAPSPIVALNHAVAIAMAHGPAEGLSRLDAPTLRGELDGEHLFHAARGDLLHRAGRDADARAAYERALSLVTNDPERRFLERRLRELA